MFQIVTALDRGHAKTDKYHQVTHKILFENSVRYSTVTEWNNIKTHICNYVFNISFYLLLIVHKYHFMYFSNSSLSLSVSLCISFCLFLFLCQSLSLCLFLSVSLSVSVCLSISFSLSHSLYLSLSLSLSLSLTHYVWYWSHSLVRHVKWTLY